MLIPKRSKGSLSALMKIPTHIKAVMIMASFSVAEQVNPGGEPSPLPIEFSWKYGTRATTLSSDSAAEQVSSGGEPLSLPIEFSWKTGAITATLSSDGTFGTLRISGEGAMDDYWLESDDKYQYPSWVFAGFVNYSPITTLVIERTRAPSKRKLLSNIHIPKCLKGQKP